MSLPDKLPTWATDLLQTAPPNNPTKVEPPQGLKDEGWLPDQRPPAEFWNWWMNLVGQWLASLRSMQIATLLQIGDQTGLTAITSASPDSIWDDGEWHYATGFSFSGGTVRSADGIRNWMNPTTPAGASTMDVVAGDGAGVVVAGGAGGELIRSTNFGDVYAVAEAPGVITVNAITGITWDPGNSLFICRSSVDEIFTSPTGANGTWTSRSWPGGGPALRGQFVRATSGAASGRIAIANSVGIYYTDDGGVSATLVSFTGGGANGGMCVGWTDADGGYFLLGTADGEVWQSNATGTSWAMVHADVGPTVLGTANDAFQGHLVSNGGGTWAALLSASGATAKSTYYYSFDAGVTWEVAPYDGVAVFRSIMYSRGRFMFGALENNGQVFNTPASP